MQSKQATSILCSFDRDRKPTLLHNLLHEREQRRCGGVIRFAEINQGATADSAGLSAPTATRKVDPAYPLQLMRENVEGTVIVYAVIHADGSVGAVRVLRGIDDRIDPFARQAISQWKFRPATKHGTPVDVEATFLIPFRPGHARSGF